MVKQTLTDETLLISTFIWVCHPLIALKSLYEVVIYFNLQAGFSKILKENFELKV